MGHALAHSLHHRRGGIFFPCMPFDDFCELRRKKSAKRNLRARRRRSQLGAAGGSRQFLPKLYRIHQHLNVIPRACMIICKMMYLMELKRAIARCCEVWFEQKSPFIYCGGLYCTFAAPLEISGLFANFYHLQ